MGALPAPRLDRVKSDEIRRTYLKFFEERGHRIVPSASLVPAQHDPSVLLTTAGMQPFKRAFLGLEEPLAKRVADVQRCFRTTDIEEVGNTARHLTFFEMLGNWSFGDYFKQESIAWGWELTTEGFGFDPEKVWVTVFQGDEELGLGPDEESIEIWRSVGVPDERIVLLPRSENFWQAGPTGPCGPCTELYFDRGEEHGDVDDRPGDDTDRFIEFWNHVFMTYDLAEDGSLSPLPQNNVDTGMGVERMAALLEDVPSVFETDRMWPLVELAEDLSGCSYSDGGKTTRAMRILADHSRGTAALIADGVVPSNEDRGYVLRRIMRRAIQQGRSIGIESPFLQRFADTALDLLEETVPRVRVRARDGDPVGQRRGGELRPHPGSRHRAARGPDRPGAAGGHLLGRGLGGLQAARHVRIPVRPDQGAAGRAGAVGRRSGLRGIDGGAARAGSGRHRHGARIRGPPRRGAQLRLGRAALALRRLREAALP